MDIQGPYNLKLPVHELITQAALIEAGIIGENDTYHSDYEYIRGVMWNDDPEGHFHYASGNVNRHITTGFFWLMEFKYFQFLAKFKPNVYCNPSSALLARSHFGDLQFLHAMSPNPELELEFIRDEMLAWAEFTFKIAIDEIPGNTLISNTKIPMITALFPLQSRHGRLTIDELFGIKKQLGDVNKRAAGSFIHMIQDSFSQGHTVREEINGKPLGPITHFSNYNEAVGKEHAEADTFGKGIKYLPNQGGVNQHLLDHIDGGEPGKIHSAQILRFIMEKADWNATVQPYLLEKVFNLKK